VKYKHFGPGVTLGETVTIGIDQSYSGFGFAVVGSDNSYFVEVVQFGGQGVDRLVDIYEYLTTKHVQITAAGNKVLDIAMEGYSYGSQVAHKAGELGAVVKMNLKNTYGVYPLIVPPTSLKKYVTGKGNASKKSQVMLHVYKKWGIELLDDNAADAYSLAKLASKHAATSYEKEVVDLLMSDPKYRERTDHVI